MLPCLKKIKNPFKKEKQQNDELKKIFQIRAKKKNEKKIAKNASRRSGEL